MDYSMSVCKHSNLVLLPPSSRRLRCRRCHLTIKAEELEVDYCPECMESSGRKYYEFEALESQHNTRYRCEECHTVIKYLAPAR